MTALAKTPLVWNDARGEVLVHLATLQVTEAEGWLLCDLELEPVAARRQRVRFAVHRSESTGGDRVRAVATIHGPRRRGWRPARRCAADIQALLWSALR